MTRRFPTTVLLLASVVVAFAVDLRLGAIGDENVRFSPGCAFAPFGQPSNICIALLSILIAALAGLSISNPVPVFQETHT